VQGLDQVSLDTSLITLGELQLGEGGEQPCRRPPFAVGPLGEALPHGGDGRQPQFATISNLLAIRRYCPLRGRQGGMDDIVLLLRADGRTEVIA
jgi:hypothetical protein